MLKVFGKYQILYLKIEGFCFFFFIFLIETGSHYVAQAGFHLPHVRITEMWPPCPAKKGVIVID
jgi:hypothetical protein